MTCINQIQKIINNKKMKENKTAKIFYKEYYLWMIIGGLLILTGTLLMIGGKSADPNVFNKDEVYSFRRITLAPILIIGGLAVEIYAIMKKGKQ
jgi:hypothetical protein